MGRSNGCYHGMGRSGVWYAAMGYCRSDGYTLIWFVVLGDTLSWFIFGNKRSTMLLCVVTGSIRGQTQCHVIQRCLSKCFVINVSYLSYTPSKILTKHITVKNLLKYLIFNNHIHIFSARYKNNWWPICSEM